MVDKSGFVQFFHGPVGTLGGNNYGSVTVSGSALTGVGRNMNISYGHESVSKVKKFKLIALDEHDLELKDFILPTGTELNVTITADSNTKIDTVNLVTGNISVFNTNSINRVITNTGDIRVEATKVGNVSTTNGSIKVKADTVGNMSTITGSVKRK